MKDITWDQSLSVEVDEIDEDHRRLVELYNLLTHAVIENESIDYIDALLVELIACTEWHFRHEERLMIKHGYEGYEQHKTEHRELIESAHALRRKFNLSERQLDSVEIEYLSGWLTGHILGQDMKLGFFLMKVM